MKEVVVKKYIVDPANVLLVGRVDEAVYESKIKLRIEGMKVFGQDSEWIVYERADEVEVVREWNYCDADVLVDGVRIDYDYVKTFCKIAAALNGVSVKSVEKYLDFYVKEGKERFPVLLVYDYYVGLIAPKMY